MNHLFGALLILGISMHALAQDPPRFQPPRPPAMDQDFDDTGEDDFDGDQPNRIVPPPAVPGTAGLNAPAPVAPSGGDFRPSTPLNNAIDQGKVRFKVVDGEFYEKGKHRGRAPLNKRTQ